MKAILRRLRRLVLSWIGRDLFPTRDVRRKTIRIGGRYGGWDLADGELDVGAVVYSFGVGTDISFDLGLIEKYGVTVHAFDPTPQSIAWVSEQTLPDRFVLHEYGLAALDGFMTFYPPDNPEHISHTAIQRDNMPPGVIQVPMKQLTSIVTELGHTTITLLKMDIEGSEYEVIEHLAKTDIRPEQLLVEFHHRFPEIGLSKTIQAIETLRQIGYRLFSVSDTGEEYGFEYLPD